MGAFFLLLLVHCADIIYIDIFLITLNKLDSLGELLDSHILQESSYFETIFLLGSQVRNFCFQFLFVFYSRWKCLEYLVISWTFHWFIGSQMTPFVKRGSTDIFQTAYVCTVIPSISRNHVYKKTPNPLSQKSLFLILFRLLKPLPSPLLSWCFSYYKSTPATTSVPSLPSKTVGFLHSPWAQNRSERGEEEKRTGRLGVFRLEQGFMTFNTICIIVCISCSVSTQCQHGWSGLISKLHRKDKRNTCRYKAILLPTGHVKLLKRTRGLLQLHEWADCCIMISQLERFFFLIEVGMLLRVLNCQTCSCNSLALADLFLDSFR